MPAAAAVFAPQQAFGVRGGPLGVAVADFNGDGRIDVATANAAGNTVSVLLNTTAVAATTSSFAAAETFATDTGPYSVAVTDINADGKPDLVVANNGGPAGGGNNVSVLINTTAKNATTATFAIKQTFAAGAWPIAVAIADINGDGKPDVIVANQMGGTVSVLLNTTPAGSATASFAPQQQVFVGTNLFSVTAADIDGDGKPDILVGAAGDSKIALLRNTTATGANSATFAALQTIAVPGAACVVVADVNRDGKPDLISASGDDNGVVAVLLNTTQSAGAPTFAAPQPFGVGKSPLYVAAADVNGDGMPDLLVSNFGDNTLSLLINATAPAGSFPAFSAQQTFALGRSALSVAAADTNADGLIDAIAANRDDGAVSVLRNVSPRVNLNQHGLTGSWFNPATGGQGFEIEVYPNADDPTQGILFGGWFTFDAGTSGTRRWYALSGLASGLNPTSNLQIFDIEGGNLNAPPALGPKGTLGTATIQFSDCLSGSLSYRFDDGRAGTIPLSRLTPNVTCTPSGDDTAATTGDYGLSGNWFAPANSGQGFMFDFSPSLNYVFGAWYTFAAHGQQLGGPQSQAWFTLQSNMFTPNLTALSGIPIIETIGGRFDQATPVVSAQVGSADIAFQNCNALTLTYRFTAGENKGLQGTQQLVRTGPVPSVCNL